MNPIYLITKGIIKKIGRILEHVIMISHLNNYP